MNKKGFTLIELLVVIAIIGILSSVAIVYLTGARNKANEAKVEQNVVTASTQTELNRSVNNWGPTDTAAISADVTSTIAKLGTHPCGKSYQENINGTTGDVAIYAVACLKSDGSANTGDSELYCADTSGFKGTTTALTAGSGKCK